MNKIIRIVLVIFTLSVMLNLAMIVSYYRENVSGSNLDALDGTELVIAEKDIESTQASTESTLTEDSVESDQSSIESADVENDIEAISDNGQLDGTRSYELRNTIVYDQLFYGTWLIEDVIAPDVGIPTSYTRFDEEGNFDGVDYTTILGQQITFDYTYVEYSGEKREYLYGPLTYTHALLSDEQLINYNYARSLSFTGDFYSTIYYVAEEYRLDRATPEGQREMWIGNLCFLHPKDNDTMYASDGVFSYLLTRVKDN